MSNKNEILTIAGKRVRVAYRKPGEDCCALCCFGGGGGETCDGLVEGEEWPCEKFNLATAYFVEAEQPEEEALWPGANPLVPDQGVTIDGKRYEKRYFRIGDACSRCAFKVGEDDKGRAFCKDHGKPEKPCTPDREKGVLVYFIAADQLQEETHTLQEWAKIMAERPDLRAEFDKMCPPQPIQGSIAPEADLEAVKDAYCDVCGHFHHTTPNYICRQDCRYYTDFINRLNPKHNGFKWHKLSEQLPPLGVPVLAFHHNWINADFNPEGIRIGHLQENCSSYDGKYDFCSAHWWDYQDCFVTISKSDIEGKEQGFSEDIVNSIMPEYWIELPMFNPKHK